MNRLIENMALDACFSKHRDGLIYSPYKEYCDITDELENFAKSIVLECARMIVQSGYRESEFSYCCGQCSPEEIASMIKSHFSLGEVVND